MKQFLFFLFLSLITAVTEAQTSASSSVAANIIAPLSIVKTVDLNFGNVAATSSAATVILAPSGTRTITGGATLPTVSGDPAAASFTVTGESSYTFSITLSSTPIYLTSGINNMTVTTFCSNFSTTGNLNNGTQTIHVGATLHIAGEQPAGVYTSSIPFDVTVNYN